MSEQDKYRAIQKAIQALYNDHGVCIDTIGTEWINKSTGETRLVLEGINISAHIAMAEDTPNV